MIRPLVELHVHLDGSLRLATMLDIARRENIPLPAKDEKGLSRALRCGTIRESLGDYLQAFGVTTSVMQSREALTRIASEFMEDSAADGVNWTEPRFMPALHTQGGLREEEVVEAVLDGIRLGGLRAGVGGGLILCSMRHVDPAVSERMAKLAVRYRKHGVVGLDMAGNDALPALEHAKHYRWAWENEVNIVVHAAESGDAERAREAIDLFRASRIGHFLRGIEDPSIVEMVRMRGIGIEACLTSNLQIKMAAAYGTHSARTYARDGLLVSLNCDNRMLADTTLTREFALARLHWELDDMEVRRFIRDAIEISFAPPHVKDVLRLAVGTM